MCANVDEPADVVPLVSIAGLRGDRVTFVCEPGGRADSGRLRHPPSANRCGTQPGRPLAGVDESTGRQAAHRHL